MQSLNHENVSNILLAARNPAGAVFPRWICVVACASRGADHTATDHERSHDAGKHTLGGNHAAAREHLVLQHAQHPKRSKYASCEWYHHADRTGRRYQDRHGDPECEYGRGLGQRPDPRR